MAKHKFSAIILGRTEEQISRFCEEHRQWCLRHRTRFVVLCTSDDLRPGVDPDEADLTDLRRSSAPGQYADDVVLVREGKPDRWLKTRNREELPEPKLSVVGAPAKVLYDVTICEGKYRFVYYEDRRDEAFRNGEPWEAGRQEMIGNKSLMSLVAEISDLRDQIENHADHEIYIGEHAFKAGYSAGHSGHHSNDTDVDITVKAEAAWNEYTPPERLCGGGVVNKPA